MEISLDFESGGGWGEGADYQVPLILGRKFRFPLGKPWIEEHTNQRSGGRGELLQQCMDLQLWASLDVMTLVKPPCPSLVHLAKQRWDHGLQGSSSCGEVTLGTRRGGVGRGEMGKKDQLMLGTVQAGPMKQLGRVRLGASGAFSPNAHDRDPREEHGFATAPWGIKSHAFAGTFALSGWSPSRDVSNSGRAERRLSGYTLSKATPWKTGIEGGPRRPDSEKHMRCQTRVSH